MNRVSDCLPDHHEEVLAYCANNGEWDIAQLVLGVWTSTISGEECYPVTHWQELVVPDEEEVKA